MERCIVVNVHRSVPCVGVSIGIERLFSIMEANLAKQTTRPRTVETQVGMSVSRLLSVFCR